MSGEKLRAMLEEARERDSEEDDTDNTENNSSRYSGSNPQTMSDGGYEAPFIQRDRRLNDDGTFNWDAFRAEVNYTIEGRVNKTVDARPIRHREGHTEVEQEATLRQKEPLKANIINVDAWFDPDVLYDAPNEIGIGDGEDFLTDYQEVEMAFFIPEKEVIAAAIQRGREDGRHPAYILGGWASQAQDADEVAGSDFVKAFERREKYFTNLPGDETMDDYRGGFDG